jgi:hypothetical protein
VKNGVASLMCEKWCGFINLWVWKTELTLRQEARERRIISNHGKVFGGMQSWRKIA